MKMRTKALLFSGMLLASGQVTAQKPKTGCVDAAVEAQAEGIKRGLKKQGLTIFQEAMIQMTSMEPAPIAVKLTEGVRYQLIFVGSEQANKLVMEIYDGRDKKVDEKIERSTNDIVYTFTPTKTDVYLITLTQKRALKSMCGYFGVLMKSSVPPATAVRAPVKEEPAKPATPPAPRPAPASATTTDKPIELPADQRPNPNRTKATREAQQQSR